MTYAQLDFADRVNRQAGRYRHGYRRTANLAVHSIGKIQLGRNHYESMFYVLLRSLSSLLALVMPVGPLFAGVAVHR